MSSIAYTIVGAVVAPLAVGAAFRALTGPTVPQDKRATYNAMAHALAGVGAWYLSEKKLRGTKADIARGAMFGEGVAATFAVAGPQILNATGAARFAGMSHETMSTMRRYYGLE